MFMQIWISPATKGGAMNTSGNSVQTYRWWNKYNGVVGHKGVYDIGTLESYVQYNALEQVKTLTSSNDGNAPWTTKTGSPMMSSRTWTAATKLVSPIELGSAGSIMLSSGLEANYETFEDAEANSHTALAGKTLDQTTLAGFMEGEYFINDEWIRYARRPRALERHLRGSPFSSCLLGL